MIMTKLGGGGVHLGFHSHEQVMLQNLNPFTSKSRGQKYNFFFKSDISIYFFYSFIANLKHA